MGNIGEKEFTEAALTWSKQNVNSLSNLILESSNGELRNECMAVLNRAFKYQQQIYDVMAQKGWYPMQMASPEDVSTAKQQIEPQVNSVINTAGTSY